MPTALPVAPSCPTCAGADTHWLPFTSQPTPQSDHSGRVILKRYLIFAVFSSATPSAMARVFQAYRCQYAMLLDMNALEHTYFAFYRANGPALIVEYLMTGMREVDTNNSVGARPMVRFIGYPDNRDFFYVMRRDEGRGGP